MGRIACLMQATRGLYPCEPVTSAELVQQFEAVLTPAQKQSHIEASDKLHRILMEAFAAGLPVVATAVGGVPGAVGDAGLLVPPADAGAAAAALERVGADQDLRERLSRAGLERVRGRTLEAESGRVAEFLSGAAGRRPTG